MWSLLSRTTECSFSFVLRCACVVAQDLPKIFPADVVAPELPSRIFLALAFGANGFWFGFVASDSNRVALCSVRPSLASPPTHSQGQSDNNTAHNEAPGLQNRSYHKTYMIYSVFMGNLLDLW